MKTILVLQAGFVFVGTLTSPTEPNTVHLVDASCIRRWGTTMGLGQLAITGPTEVTKLDPCGDLTAPVSSVIFMMACPGWK